MMGYTIQQWLLFFYIYCFIGWCFESTYVSLRKKRFVNRGFLNAPLLPIYGSGAVVMLFVTRGLQDNIVLMFLAGMAGATTLELVVGFVMEAIFKIKYWDYSNQKFNYKGVICLSSSLCWGVFTVLLNKVIHKPVEEFVLGLSDVAVIVAVSLLSILFICDTVVSVKVALGIRDMLDVKVRLRKELNEAQEQLAGRISEMKNELEEKKDYANERFDLMVDSLNEKLNALIGMLDDKEKEEPGVMSRLGDKLKALKREKETQDKKMSYLKIKMLKRNPSATSRKFAEEFAMLRTEQVKKYEERKKEKKEEKLARRKHKK